MADFVANGKSILAFGADFGYLWGMNVKIQSGVAGDAGAVADIWNYYIRSSTVTFNSVEKTADEVRAMMLAHPFFIAVRGGEVVGFATYREFRRGVGYARSKEHTIMVAHDNKAGGAGRALMEALESHARAAGVHSLFAAVSGGNNAAIAFHETRGFTVVANIPEAGWKNGRYYELVLMQKLLNDERLAVSDSELEPPEPFKDWTSFVEHWAGLYYDKPYADNIDEELTEDNLKELYSWKSNSPASFPKNAFARHLKFLKKHPKSTPDCKKSEDEILNREDKEDNAPIFNIFFLHVLSKNQNLNGQTSCVYPIFDQHVRRAMHSLGPKNESFEEWNRDKKGHKLEVYEEYEKYREFYKNIERITCGRIKNDPYGRKIDRALFEFGKSLIKK